MQGLPGIDTLITPSIIARHPALFSSPDTDLRELGLTFTIQGPRITSHDIKAVTPDYSALADGWFDLDKNIDMNAHLLLSQELSREIDLNDVAESISRNFGVVFQSQMLWVDTLDALLGRSVGLPMHPPKELRELHNEDETTWA